MKAYFLRRILLVPPTLIGITLIVFALTRILPGGPVEAAIAEATLAADTGGTQLSRGTTGTGGISSEQVERLRAYYGFDRPWPIAYLEWVGDVFQGDLGRSFRFNIPVTEMIVDKLPVSLFYGVATFLLTYGVCIPLGIAKALYHRSWFDGLSSLAVFAGYAIPGYVLASLLLVTLAFQTGWFPTGGFTGSGFAEMSPWGQFIDLLHHAALPLICYMIGSFAVLTLLMKNSLLDNLAADFMKTATAKGLARRRALFRHAFRNSLIPIATNFGQNISIFLTGSFLIEMIFNIDGFGLLSYNAVIQRDYPLVMAILLISALLLLVGNILSDMLVAAIDPRIRFD